MNDTTFDALANERRRALLLDLLVASPRDDTAHSSTGALQTKHRIQTEMFHTHLPKLEDYGFIRWDRDTHEIDQGPRFEAVRPLLEFIDDSTER